MGGPVGSAGRPGFPTREPALPTEGQLESRVLEAQGRVILLERGGSQPVAARGDRLVSPANGTPGSLETGSSLRVINSLPLRFY